ncbi:MAG: argininosuccinate lyase [Spirochaetales bacterium]|nr:argininosuccinate lyase [Spirochaetales bacterium]
MSKLWDKDYKIDTLLEEYTVGKDYLLDQDLVIPDCFGSLAQARMLLKVGILTPLEEEALHRELVNIIEDARKGLFRIRQEDEDCHTAIENRLVERLGEIGKKIHTGRSRNDQVLTALRIYGREQLLDIFEKTLALTCTLLNSAKIYQNVPMPGRTHTQLAMPSSLGLWFSAFGEELLDALELLQRIYELWNRCPLGSAASYGTPLPLDREYTSELLGFSSVQNNVLAANNSRGKLEAMILEGLDQIGITLSKLSTDLILFSLPEIGYFSLPREFCTGSSIMPQKQNPDGLELTRAKAAVLGSYALMVKSIIRSLPSGYNRDFQETKEPFLRGLSLCLQMVQVTNLLVQNLKVNEEALRKGFTPDIFATDAVYEQVQRGIPFREAYKKVGKSLDSLTQKDPDSALSLRTSTGTPGNLRLDVPRKRMKTLGTFTETQKASISRALERLATVSAVE